MLFSHGEDANLNEPYPPHYRRIKEVCRRRVGAQTPDNDHQNSSQRSVEGVQ